MHTEALQLQDGERWLYAYAAEAGSRSAQALRLLGTWAATQDAEGTAPEAAEPAPGRSVVASSST